MICKRGSISMNKEVLCEVTIPFRFNNSFSLFAQHLHVSAKTLDLAAANCDSKPASYRSKKPLVTSRRKQPQTPLKNFEN